MTATPEGMAVRLYFGHPIHPPPQSINKLIIFQSTITNTKSIARRLGKTSGITAIEYMFMI